LTHLAPTPWRAAGEFVAALAIFAAGVQRGEHQLDAGHAVLRVDVDGDAAAVVADGDGAVDVDGDLDACEQIAGEMFVDGVVENLGNAVVEGALIGAADIHAGLLADGLEALRACRVWRRRRHRRRPVDHVAFLVGLIGHEMGFARVEKGRKNSRDSAADARVF